MTKQRGFINFEVFYDGDCPMCHREIEMIRRMDKRQLIVLTNIADPNFEASETGLSHEVLMRAIHARFIDLDQQTFRWITGVEVFREIYSRLGFVTATRLSRLPVVRHVLNLGYRVFAYFRFKLAMRRLNRKICNEDVCGPLSNGSLPTTKSLK